MAVRRAEAEWHGDLPHGSGRMRLGSGAFEGPFDYRSRMGDGRGTNPEELIAAAHAGCFSMALAYSLSQAGFTPERIHTTAQVQFDQRNGGWSIHTIKLRTEGVVPGISEAVFADQAQAAKRSCPVSRALAGVAIQLTAKLL